MGTGTKKLTWLLILQAWTMLWVVIGHAPLHTPYTVTEFDNTFQETAQLLFSFAYSFHMPLFIIISGYLFFMTRISKDWEMGRMVWEKFLRLGIPYFVFITLALIIKILLPGEVSRQVDLSFTGLIITYFQPFNGALQEMWFIAAIFIYFLLFPLYRYILKSNVAVIIVLLVSIGLYFIPSSYLTSWFAIDKAVHFFVYFFIGILIRRYQLDNLLADTKSILAFGLIYALTMWLKIPIFYQLSASLAFWGLAIKVDRTLSDNLFHSFRDYTYQIFLIGIFAQIFAKILARKIVFPGSYAVWWMICILIGIYVPVLLSKVPYFKKSKIYRYMLGL